MDMNLPRHVVIVPDGNRRWAEKINLPSFLGHRAGAKAVDAVLKSAKDLQLEYLTLWACSVGNLTKRSPVEVKFLYKIFEQMFQKMEKQFKSLEQDGIRIQVLGRWQEFFPAGLKKRISRLTEKTAKFNQRTLTLLMAYDGREEMVQAVRSIVKNRAKPGEIDGSVIKSSLWSRDLPPVDLVIRTGGEPHWSAGLMMWDVAEARLYFTKTLWPDFTPAEFRKALKAYAGVERRSGK